LHQGALFVHSPTLENIFTLPSGVANDGADEDHPIVLPGISGEEFEHFISWLLHLYKYTIPQWIAPSVRSLTLASLSAIDEDEALVLGVRVYSIIARAREVMETERHPIAAVSPGLSVPPSPACNISHHAHCKVVWTCFWWQKVARQLLHPYNPLAISALVEYVAQQANPDSLNLECKSKLCQSSGRKWWA
ncbi:hypothetical protein EDC04DRAFT_2577152, partial [Pisolithus marmoratus]